MTNQNAVFFNLIKWVHSRTNENYNCSVTSLEHIIVSSSIFSLMTRHKKSSCPRVLLIYNLQRHELQPGENKILIGIKNDKKWQKKLLSLQVSREEAKKKKEKNSGFDVIRPAPPGYNMDASNLIPKIGSKQLGANAVTDLHETV